MGKRSAPFVPHCVDTHRGFMQLHAVESSRENRCSNRCHRGTLVRRIAVAEKNQIVAGLKGEDCGLR